MGKRGATSVAVPAWKRHRSGTTVRAKILAVVAALEDGAIASEAPEIARKMLAAGAPKALGTTVEQRHTMQETIVGHIREALLDSSSRLAARAADARRTADGTASEVITFKAQFQAANDDVDEADKDLEAKHLALGEASGKVSEAKEELRKGKHSEEVLAKEKDAIEKEQAKYRGIVDGDLKVLLEHGSEAKDATKISDRLVKELVKLGAESALQAAVPSAMLKKPEERQGFDGHVLQSCQDMLNGRLHDIAARLEAKVAEITALQPDLTVKSDALAQAEAVHASASAATDAAVAKLDQLRAAATDKHQELQTAEASLQEHQHAADELEAETAAFQEVVACLEFLASRSNVVVPAEEEAVGEKAPDEGEKAPDEGEKAPETTEA